MIKVIDKIAILIILVAILAITSEQPVYAADGDDTADKTVITTGASGNVDITIDVKGKGELSTEIDGPAKMDITAGQDVKLDVRAGKGSQVTINGERYDDSKHKGNEGSEFATRTTQAQISGNSEINSNDNTMLIIAASAAAGLLVLFIAGCYFRKNHIRKLR